MAYYQLLTREDGVWTSGFGDKVKAVVQQERRDVHESWPFPKLKDLKVVETNGTPACAQLWCDDLNRQQQS